MMKKNAAMLGIAGVLAAAIGVYVGVKTKGTARPPVTTTVAPAPAGAAHGPVEALFAQSMNGVDGKPQAFAQYRGKPLVVNFWATWCAPCVEEMPELSTLATEQSGKIHILGIGIDSPSNISTFAAKHKISYPVFNAGMGGTDLARDFGNKGGGLPFTVLIGADGQVKKTYLGRLKFEQLKADLAAL
jgi:thiol-disulfide isomerase/thioredoxin